MGALKGLKKFYEQRADAIIAEREAEKENKGKKKTRRKASPVVYHYENKARGTKTVVTPGSRAPRATTKHDWRGRFVQAWEQPGTKRLFRNRKSALRRYGHNLQPVLKRFVVK